MLRSAAKTQPAEAGFTLVEVLVALAILSVALAVLLITISNGIRYQIQARTVAEANAVAQSLLAEIGKARPLSEGQLEGVSSNGFPWRLRMEAYGVAGAHTAWALAAYNVTVEVFPPAASGTRKAPLVTLTTLRLGARGANR